MNKLIMILFAAFLIGGCENNDLLQSESKLNEKVNGRWKKVLGSSQDPKETWKFENGSLTITKVGEDTVTDHGSYSISTKFSRSYLTITGIEDSALFYWDLNRQWTIAELSNTVMYLSTTTQTGAIISREFVKTN